MTIFYDKILQLEKKLSKSKLRKFFYYLPNKIFYLLFKIGLKNEIVNKKTFFGSKMKLALPYAKDIFIYGFTNKLADLNLCKFLLKSFNKNSVFVDVGAQFGFFSLFVSSTKNKNLKVFAFEPSKFNFEILKENSKNIKNLFIENKATGNENKIINFFEYENKSTVYEISNKLDKQIINIEMIILDNYFTVKNIKPDFIRINVEKFIPEIIEGLRNTLTLGSCDFIIKYIKNNDEEENFSKLIALFKRYNYGIFKINENGELEKLKTKKSLSEQLNFEFENLILRHSTK